MNEPKPISPLASATPAAGPPSNSAATAKPAPVAGPVAVAASQSAPLFGGHRGGGKKRLDGLVAGSPAAIAADKEKDRDRKRLEAAKKKMAALPAALPSAPSSTGDAGGPLAGGSIPLPVPVAGVAVPAAVPLFVGWNQKLLEKPARLLTKIADRLRCWSLLKRVRKLNLPPALEKEIEGELKFRDDVVNDFNTALAECATVELNKRRVGGSEHSHWINLGMCGGEMILTHMHALDRLEKIVLEQKTKNDQPAKDAVKN